MIKPVQRICRYTLLLQNIINHADSAVDADLIAQLNAGIAAVSRAASRVNELSRIYENDATARELTASVDNWLVSVLNYLLNSFCFQGFDPSQFGQLLLNSTVKLLRDGKEQSMFIYLFEQIIVCCSFRDKSRLRLSKRASSKLVFRGAITMKEMRGVVVVNEARSEATDRDFKFDLRVYYKNRSSNELESYVFRFLYNDSLRAWKDTLDASINRLKRSSEPAKRSTRLTTATPFAAEKIEEFSPFDSFWSTEMISTEDRRRQTAAITPLSPNFAVPQTFMDDASEISSAFHISSSDFSLRTSSIRSPVSPVASMRQIDSFVDTQTSSTFRQRMMDLDQTIHQLGLFIVDKPDERLCDQRVVDATTTPPSTPDPLMQRHRSTTPPPPPPPVSNVQPDTLTPQSPLTQPPPPLHPPKVTLKIHCEDEIFLLATPVTVSFSELKHIVATKIQHDSNSFKMRYMDNENDLITFHSDEDLNLAMEHSLSAIQLHLFILII